MSEFLEKNNLHYENIKTFCKQIIEGEDGRKLYEQYKNDILSVTRRETYKIVDWMVSENYDIDVIKLNLNKILNLFSAPLESEERPPEIPLFLKYLTKENKKAVEILNQQKKHFIRLNRNWENPEYEELFYRFTSELKNLNEFNLHYIKKENILFPYIEKYMENHQCLQVMWSMHDDIRRNLKTVLSSNPYNVKKQEFNKIIGRLYFDIFAVIFREENILFPLCISDIPDTEWDKMYDDSFEIGFSYITPPKKTVSSQNLTEKNGIFSSRTGELNHNQLKLIFDNLPVDVTFVDENDKVVFFSNPPDRIFPRTPAIIGRTVQKCHPKESVDAVNEVIRLLKSGEKDSEDFWLEFNGRFILIRYLALRNEKGEFKGILEVSQDVTSIRSLTGEKRLPGPGK